MSDKKRIEEGPPIWVESTLGPEEYRAAAAKYPSVFKRPKPVDFDPNYHKGGRWRYKMGQAHSADEIKTFNKGLDDLHNLIKTKGFQRRPEYGTHNEAKP